MAIQLPDNTPWHQWALVNLPKRMSDYGLSGQFTGLTFILPQDVQWQALSEAALARCQNLPTSPDDELPYVGQEAGLPQYATEANAAFRLRLANKWNVWKEAASQGGILNQLQQAGFPSASYQAFLDFNLPGGGDNGITNPADPGYSPEYAGTGIPLYPSSLGWWSQFALIFVLTTPIGTGALGRSQLLNDDQLRAIQLITAKFKPANWVCRELIIEYLPTSGSVVWDQLDTTGSYVYHYDTSPITWSGSDVLPAGDVVEHLPALNTWRWRPIFPQQGD